MGAMSDAMGGAPSDAGAAPIDAMDAAMGSAMDGAMDQGGPAGGDAASIPAAPTADEMDAVAAALNDDPVDPSAGMG